MICELICFVRTIRENLCYSQPLKYMYMSLAENTQVQDLYISRDRFFLSGVGMKVSLHKIW